MEQIVASMSSYLIDQMNDESMLEEFGFTKQDKDRIKELVNTYFTHHLMNGLQQGKGEIQLQIDNQTITGAENVICAIESLDETSIEQNILLGKTEQVEEEQYDKSQYEIIWESHHWNKAYEFLDEVPFLNEDKEYVMAIEVPDERKSVDLSFSICMIAAMILKNHGKMIDLGVSVEDSKDKMNHAKLYQKDKGRG